VRQPNFTVNGTISSPASTPPSGTPICRTDRTKFITLCGVRGTSRCVLAVAVAP